MYGIVYHVLVCLNTTLGGVARLSGAAGAQRPKRHCPVLSVYQRALCGGAGRQSGPLSGEGGFMGGRNGYMIVVGGSRRKRGKVRE
jgi:hypothetical protein